MVVGGWTCWSGRRTSRGGARYGGVRRHGCGRRLGDTHAWRRRSLSLVPFPPQGVGLPGVALLYARRRGVAGSGYGIRTAGAASGPKPLPPCTRPERMRVELSIGKTAVVGMRSRQSSNWKGVGGEGPSSGWGLKMWRSAPTARTSGGGRRLKRRSAT